MENNIKKWILDYGVIAHRRFYRNEKIRFIQHIERDFHEMKYKTSILAPKGSKGKAINLLIGDVKNAKNIIIAAYDTPVKSFGLYKYKPFDLRKRYLQYMITVLIPLFIITLTCFILSSIFLKIEWLKGIFRIEDLLAMTLYLIGIILIVRYAKGIPNSRNLNRNSSGVVALLSIASKLNDKERASTAFVLTDFGCINHLGDQMLKAYLQDYQKQHFIILDCVGTTDTPALCYTKSFQNSIKKLDSKFKRCPVNDTNYNIAQLYPNTLVVSCVEETHNSLICKNVNTKNDTDVDFDNITYIAEQIIKLL